MSQRARRVALANALGAALARVQVGDPESGDARTLAVPADQVADLVNRGQLAAVRLEREQVDSDLVCLTISARLSAEVKARLARLYAQRPDRPGQPVVPISGVPEPESPRDPTASQPSAQSTSGPPSAGDSVRLTVGSRIWLSQGKYAFNFGNVGGPNVASELAWQGQNMPIYELSADLVVKRFVASMAAGYGDLQKGTLRDQDWNGDNRTQLLSDTLSPLTKGTVWYVSIDLGTRLLHWQYAGSTGAVDLLAGFQYWREHYSAYGLIDSFCAPPICPVSGAGQRDTPTSITTITETIQWRNLRFGSRAHIPLFSRAQVIGSVFYIPYSSFQMDDFHPLRPDLAQNPSGTALATGGSGVQLEGAVRVSLWRGFLLEAGYRYWDIRMGQGTITLFGSDGSVSPQPLNQANARRQGVFLALLWAF